MKIGIVDDEPITASAIRRILRLPLEERSLTPEFLVAANPLDFLQKLADTKDEVKLVLSDTNMPIATGFDLAQLLAHRIAGRPIPSHFRENGPFHEVYDRIAADTIRQTRIILLSGDYDESAADKPAAQRWKIEYFGGQHEHVLTSLHELEKDLPPRFFHTVLSKPYDAERLRQVVFDALGIE